MRLCGQTRDFVSCPCTGPKTVLSDTVFTLYARPCMSALVCILASETTRSPLACCQGCTCEECFDFAPYAQMSRAHALFAHAAPGSSLDDLLGKVNNPGSNFLNSSITTEAAPPGVAQNYASAGQQHNFDALQGTSVGRSGQPQVNYSPELSVSRVPSV